jgi:hypothetical protein
MLRLPATALPAAAAAAFTSSGALPLALAGALALASASPLALAGATALASASALTLAASRFRPLAPRACSVSLWHLLHLLSVVCVFR